jgi:hypothetical protein
MNWQDFPDDARVWIYPSPERLTHQQQQDILQAASQFLQSWKAHGAPLKATAAIFYDHFLVFFVDEAQAGASGCSIDSSVRFVKELEVGMGLSLLERARIYYEEDGVIRNVHFKEAEELNSRNVRVFNFAAPTLAEFRQHVD